MGGLEACMGVTFREPLCWEVEEGLGSLPGSGAVFLNVIVHSISSPANTVDFVKCTEARMYEDVIC